MNCDTNLGVSAVICTINRGDAIRMTVDSVLRNRVLPIDLLVVDQSRESSLAAVVNAIDPSGLVRYVHGQTEGLAAARNLGVDASAGEIIAFTDDDCIVASDWIEQIAGVFTANPRVAMLFGNVEAAPHNVAAGLIPSCERASAFTARTISDKNRLGSMGACMAIRRSAFRTLGGFDPRLGAGARFRSAEETDLVLRALRSGFWVYESPAVRVVHHGLRAKAQHDALVFSYLFGTGATFAKHLRLGTPGVSRLLVDVGWTWAFGRPRVHYSPTPRKLLRLSSFVRGWLEGIRAPLDRERSCFADVGPSTARREPNAIGSGD